MDSPSLHMHTERHMRNGMCMQCRQAGRQGGGGEKVSRQQSPQRRDGREEACLPGRRPKTRSLLAFLPPLPSRRPARITNYHHYHLEKGCRVRGSCRAAAAGVCSLQEEYTLQRTCLLPLPLLLLLLLQVVPCPAQLGRRGRSRHGQEEVQ